MAAQRRNPRLARAISVVPGLGQLYYGAPKRAGQYFLGVAGCFVLAGLVYNLSFSLATVHVSPILASIGFLLSELVALALVVSAISFWIAASWDARQGARALNDGTDYRPTWWFVKLKQLLFDDPEEETADE